MTEILPFALSLFTGFLLIAAFDPVAGAGPRWAVLLFRISLGSCVGIGFSAIVYFTLLITGFAKPAIILAFEIACAGVFATLWILRRPSRASCPARPPNTGGMRIPRILAVVFVCVLLLVGGRLTQIAIANPTGDWDASAIWNLRARFLTDRETWRFVASPIAGTRPEYPLLISSFIARGWKLSGAYPTIVPVLLALTFWALLSGLLVSVLAILCGTAAAMLAGLVLLSTAPLSWWATAQYADIPLACYFLATLALLFIDAGCQRKQPWALVWAGVCAGLAAGTKNEGDVFAALVAVAFLVSGPNRRRIGFLFAGMIPSLLPTVFLMLFLRAPSQLLTGQTMAGVLANIKDPVRYNLIGKSLLDRLAELGSGPGHPLILLACLVLIVRAPGDKRHTSAVWISFVAAGGMLLSYLGVYVITPLDLPWYLSTSLDRVLLQIWPCLVLLFCRLLPDDASFAWPRPDANRAASRITSAR